MRPADSGNIQPHTDSPTKVITLVVSMVDEGEWAVTERYMTLETLAQISHPVNQPMYIAEPFEGDREAPTVQVFACFL